MSPEKGWLVSHSNAGSPSWALGTIYTILACFASINLMAVSASYANPASEARFSAELGYFTCDGGTYEPKHLDRFGLQNCTDRAEFRNFINSKTNPEKAFETFRNAYQEAFKAEYQVNPYGSNLSENASYIASQKVLAEEYSTLPDTKVGKIERKIALLKDGFVDHNERYGIPFGKMGLNQLQMIADGNRKHHPEVAAYAYQMITKKQRKLMKLEVQLALAKAAQASNKQNELNRLSQTDQTLAALNGSEARPNRCMPANLNKRSTFSLDGDVTGEEPQAKTGLSTGR